MLRLDRVGLRAAARAETGWRPEGVRVRPFVAAALGDRVWLREGEPLAEELSAVEDLGVPGLRGDADMALVKVWPNRRVGGGVLASFFFGSAINSAIVRKVI